MYNSERMWSAEGALASILDFVNVWARQENVVEGTDYLDESGADIKRVIEDIIVKCKKRDPTRNNCIICDNPAVIFQYQNHYRFRSYCNECFKKNIRLD